jgi:hypothetical protein
LAADVRVIFERNSKRAAPRRSGSMQRKTLPLSTRA